MVAQHVLHALQPHINPIPLQVHASLALLAATLPLHNRRSAPSVHLAPILSILPAAVLNVLLAVSLLLLDSAHVQHVTWAQPPLTLQQPRAQPVMLDSSNHCQDKSAAIHASLVPTPMLLGHHHALHVPKAHMLQTAQTQRQHTAFRAQLVHMLLILD